MTVATETEHTAPDNQAHTLDRRSSTTLSLSERDLATDKPGSTSSLPKQQSGMPDDTQEQPPQVSEKPSHPTANDVSSIPNGGLQAWLQVLGGFMLFFNTWGILNAFGAFQTFYESGQLFQESSSNISWIGAIQAYCVLVVGFFSGPIYDRGYLRTLLVVGSFGIVFGHMMLSLCTTFWQVLLAQGFCVGLGAGCLFVPAVAILPTYFTNKIGLTIGLAAAGSSMGGVIYPIVFYRLLFVNQIGFAWSVRTLGFIALATLVIPISVMRMRVKPAHARALIDWSAFTDWPFMMFTVGAMIGFMGLYVMLFYTSYYANDQRITDASLSFYLVAILNAASVFGRTIPNYFSDKTGPLNLIAPGAIVVSVTIFAMIGVKHVASIVIVTLLFGFFSGVFIALPPVCFVVLTKDKSRIGTRIGMGFAMIGFGVLTGGPGGGAILGQQEGDLHWTSLFVFGGVTAMASGCIFIALRIWRSGTKLMVKA